MSHLSCLFYLISKYHLGIYSMSFCIFFGGGNSTVYFTAFKQMILDDELCSLGKGVKNNLMVWWGFAGFPTSTQPTFIHLLWLYKHINRSDLA